MTTQTPAGAVDYTVAEVHEALRRFDNEYSDAAEGWLSIMPLTGLGRLEPSDTEGVFVLRVIPDAGVPKRTTRFLLKVEMVED